MLNNIKSLLSSKWAKLEFQVLLYYLRRYKLNIVYNQKKTISEKYKKKYFNILLITESPEYAENIDWFKYDYLYDLEVSFRNNTKAEMLVNINHQYCNVDIFAGEFYTTAITQKERSAVLLISKKSETSGHLNRKIVYNKFNNSIFPINYYGSYVNKSYSDSALIYSKHRYSVVIENSKNGVYLSEKIFDSIKGGSIIFYWGNIDLLTKYGFKISSIIPIKSMACLHNQIIEFDKEFQKNITNLQESIIFNQEHLKKLRKVNVNNFLKNLYLPLFIKESGGKSTRECWKKYFS